MNLSESGLKKVCEYFRRKRTKKDNSFIRLSFFRLKFLKHTPYLHQKKTFIHILYISTKTNNSTQKLKFLEDFYGRKEDKKVDLSVDIIPIKGYNINIT